MMYGFPTIRGSVSSFSGTAISIISVVNGALMWMEDGRSPMREGLRYIDKDFHYH